MDGRRESHREQSEIKIHNEKYPSTQRDQSYKSIIYNQQRSIFREYDRIRNHQLESKTTQIKERTLFTLDCKNIKTEKEIENQRNRPIRLSLEKMASGMLNSSNK